MALKLYGSRVTACTQRAAIVLYEKRIPFTLVAVHLGKNDQTSSEYLKKQPFGQVPYLDDDGFILYESRAICRYLTKYADRGPKLIPTDPKKNALFEQAVSIETITFDYPASKAVYEVLVKKFLDLKTDEALLRDHIDNLDSNLDVYDKILSKQKYLVGDELTLADLFHLPNGHWLCTMGAGGLFERRPNVKRWWDEIYSRPSWQEIKGGVKSID